MTLALLLATVLAAPTGGPDSVSTPKDSSGTRIEVRAVRLTNPITVDGVLNEPVWQSDNAVTHFIARDPVEGAPPTQRTEVRVAYDDDAIYFGARMYDSAPDSIIARLTR